VEVSARSVPPKESTPLKNILYPAISCIDLLAQMIARPNRLNFCQLLVRFPGKPENLSNGRACGDFRMRYNSLPLYGTGLQFIFFAQVTSPRIQGSK